MSCHLYGIVPVCVYFTVRFSLVPGAEGGEKSTWCLHVHACANKLQKKYLKGSVNVSVNDLSHMARSSMEAVHACSKQRARNHLDCELLQLKRLSSQSRIVKEPVIFNLL